MAHTGNDSAGIEYGCYVMTGTTSGTLTPDVTPATCPGTVDTNDDAGLSDTDSMKASTPTALSLTTIRSLLSRPS